MFRSYVTKDTVSDFYTIQKIERADWDKLESLATEATIKEFYTEYAHYLKKHHLISRHRKILYRMANMIKDKI